MQRDSGERGLSSLKLYGMAGVPSEAAEDQAATLALLRQLRKAAPRVKLTYGCSTFMRMAHTSMQHFGVRRDAEKALRRMRGELARAGFTFRPESYAWSVVQAAVSRGDRKVARVLEVAADSGGGAAAVRRAFKKLKGEVPPLEHYAHADWNIGAVLPWAHLATAIPPQLLVSARRDAEKHFDPPAPSSRVRS